jgi:hypothetical protein
MIRFASLFVLALLAAGCASRSAIPATAAASRAPHAEPAQAAPPASRVVELRHFYLLSPGPNARLVVTRSDLATGAISSTESTSATAAAPSAGLQ